MKGNNYYVQKTSLRIIIKLNNLYDIQAFANLQKKV